VATLGEGRYHLWLAHAAADADADADGVAGAAAAGIADGITTGEDGTGVDQWNAMVL